MNFSVRGLSIFLILLQLLAPLIHAHKNETNLTALFHLPEFEQINALPENNSAIFVSASSHDQIVTISAGMKNNKRRFLFDAAVDFFLTLLLIIVNKAFICFIAFFVCKLSVKTRRFNLSLPRAPPFPV